MGWSHPGGGGPPRQGVSRPGFHLPFPSTLVRWVSTPLDIFHLIPCGLPASWVPVRRLQRPVNQPPGNICWSSRQWTRRNRSGEGTWRRGLAAQCHRFQCRRSSAPWRRAGCAPSRRASGAKCEAAFDQGFARSRAWTVTALRLREPLDAAVGSAPDAADLPLPLTWVGKEAPRISGRAVGASLRGCCVRWM